GSIRAVKICVNLRRNRSPSLRRRPSRRDLQKTRRAHFKSRPHQRRKLRRLGATSFGRKCRRRFQWLERSTAPDAHARQLGCVGIIYSQTHQGRSLQVRDSASKWPTVIQSRSLRTVHGGSSKHFVDCLRLEVQVSRRPLAKETRCRRTLPPATLDLRSPLRLLASKSGGRQSTANLS